MTTTTTAWWQYIEEGLERNGLNQSHLADTIGLNRGGMSQWRNGGVAPRDKQIIRAVAEALGTSVLEALVAAGYLTQDEWEAERNATPIEERTDEELLQELLRRAQKRKPTPQPEPVKKPARSTVATRKTIKTTRTQSKRSKS
ncbi:helix-turn-helix domain-containing protein [Rhodococcus ruber]|uniref:helix-turn-helix domain-containing protein n=1 Tax=Rhodococcus ruber TaxID=1830 RepID=UPI001E5420C7|nr:helix-turn-helix transcriptional regulator [Rhodococcus ruber]MCD2127023.1 helix-turn-helix domain-containing protein [Rhodococcus ruber]MCZ4506340.1 helix-turn-helix transcriptional regulator [Rhodococcus ruber]